MQYLENDRIKIAVADHGAELCSIYDKKRGHEVVWQADPKYWNRHAPVLFPFSALFNFSSSTGSISPSPAAAPKDLW